MKRPDEYLIILIRLLKVKHM